MNLKKQLESFGIKVTATGLVKKSDIRRALAASDLEKAIEQLEEEYEIKWQEAFIESAIGEDVGAMVDSIDTAKNIAKKLKIDIQLDSDDMSILEKAYDTLSEKLGNMSLIEADKFTKNMWSSSLSGFIYELFEDEDD